MKLLKTTKLKAIITTLFMQALLLGSATHSQAVLIDFESVADNTGLGVTVTNQFSVQGVTFASAVALTAQLSLNEIDFPPHSGSTVVSNTNSGIMRLDFAAPLLDIGGFFTYSLGTSNKLLLQAYDIDGNLLGTRSSTFSDNTADIFGEPGSSPNEFLQLAHIGAIHRLDINGQGGDFTLDDLQFTPGIGATPSVPEPAIWFFLFLGLAAVIARRSALHNR